ncbi:hypothetical protein F4804DRAFT_130980 [Jackrogersella minutella]|nr:hypothetical protein F4804DRAFT_130980 [Jackrogersella minutella]
MPQHQRTSKKVVLAGQTSKSDQEPIREESPYTDNYTQYRPPHLNGKNISSAQHGGSNTHPRGHIDVKTYKTESDPEYVMDDIDGNYTYNPPSITYTNSTLKAGDPFSTRPDLAYMVNRDYANFHENGQPITSQNIAAFNRLNETQHHGSNVYDWTPPQVGYNFHADSGRDWSTCYLMPSSASTGRASTTGTNWVCVPSTSGDSSGEMLYAAGGWHDIPAGADSASPPGIREEDLITDF